MKESKLDILARIEGFDDYIELLQETIYDSICPGICTTKDCDYTSEVEPDSDSGYCEICDNNTVKSALVIAGLI